MISKLILVPLVMVGLAKALALDNQRISQPTMTRPSLIVDLRRELPNVPARWNINDASLRPVPPLYPPLNPRCTVFVGNTMPSVVAVRISECLRKQSIAVEFDDESHTATCMTMDRVHFTIHLYRGAISEDGTKKPDFSHGVVVECMRVRGDVIPFHYTVRAIFRAAKGVSDGADIRRFKSPMEVPAVARASLLPRKRKATAGLMTGLEDALVLLKKDRICAQRLGMERLVMLTDEDTSGMEIAVYTSKAVLGDGSSESATEGASTWILTLIEDRVAPGEVIEILPEQNNSSNISVLEESTVSSDYSTLPELQDIYHGGVLRALAMRAFANALSVLSKYESESLRSILSDKSQLVSESFLEALVEDLAGASRPPGIAAGTRLASSHEAALAAKCLSILAQYSEAATKILIPPKQDKQPVLDALDRARNVGLASNVFLQQESEQAFFALAKQNNAS
jgi:hypothetical protein